MTYDRLIKFLGGENAVAQRCGITPSAVYQWRHNGLPSKRRKALFLDYYRNCRWDGTKNDAQPGEHVWAYCYDDRSGTVRVESYAYANLLTVYRLDDEGFPHAVQDFHALNLQEALEYIYEQEELHQPEEKEMERKEHPNAQWLRALADGHELQVRSAGGTVWSTPPAYALVDLLQGGDDYAWRVKVQEPTWEGVAEYLSRGFVGKPETAAGQVYKTGSPQLRECILLDYGSVFTAAKKEMMEATGE